MFLYKALSYIIYPFLFIYLKYRVMKNKEHHFRFKEKLGKTNLEKKNNLIWFHVASLGEIKSIFEIVKHYQSFKETNILITSVTLSSSEFFEKYLKSENTFHQFAPIDSPIIVKKFLKYWRPKVSIFVESELWPNMITEATKYSKLILLNCRISKKSFNKWKFFKKNFFTILNNFDDISAQSNETKEYLNFFGVKKVSLLGNLKFIFKQKKSSNIFNIEKNSFNWAGMSIHFEEVDIILNIHKKLSNLNSSITTFLIPRHLNRLEQIKKKIVDKNIFYLETSKNQVIKKFNGIVLVDQFGIADEIFDKVNFVFMGGSFIDHGGQNPIEPVKFGCKIFYGKNNYNFTEIYQDLDKKNLSKLVNNEEELYNELKIFINNNNFTKTNNDLNKFNKEILSSNIEFLNKYIKLEK